MYFLNVLTNKYVYCVVSAHGSCFMFNIVRKFACFFLIPVIDGYSNHYVTDDNLPFAKSSGVCSCRPQLQSFLSSVSYLHMIAGQKILHTKGHSDHPTLK